MVSMKLRDLKKRGIYAKKSSEKSENSKKILKILRNTQANVSFF